MVKTLKRFFGVAKVFAVFKQKKNLDGNKKFLNESAN